MCIMNAVPNSFTVRLAATPSERMLQFWGEKLSSCAKRQMAKFTSAYSFVGFADK